MMNKTVDKETYRGRCDSVLTLASDAGSQSIDPAYARKQAGDTISIWLLPLLAALAITAYAPLLLLLLLLYKWSHYSPLIVRGKIIRAGDVPMAQMISDSRANKAVCGCPADITADHIRQYDQYGRYTGGWPEVWQCLSATERLRGEYQGSAEAAGQHLSVGRQGHGDRIRGSEVVVSEASKQAFVVQANEVLDLNYRKINYNVTAFATDMALSRRHLSRKMRHFLGTSPCSYIRVFRLKKSLLLLGRGMGPSTVCYEVGFSSHSYFDRCFKAYFKKSPSQYRGGRGNSR